MLMPPGAPPHTGQQTAPLPLPLPAANSTHPCTPLACTPVPSSSSAIQAPIQSTAHLAQGQRQALARPLGGDVGGRQVSLHTHHLVHPSHKLVVVLNDVVGQLLADHLRQQKQQQQQ